MSSTKQNELSLPEVKKRPPMAHIKQVNDYLQEMLLGMAANYSDRVIYQVEREAIDRLIAIEKELKTVLPKTAHALLAELIDIYNIEVSKVGHTCFFAGLHFPKALQQLDANANLHEYGIMTETDLVEMLSNCHPVGNAQS